MNKTTTPPKKQFSRPSVVLEAPAIERDWQHVAPEVISIGDIIADFGLVQTIELSKDPEGRCFTNIIGVRAVFPTYNLIYAFTAVSVA